MTKYAAENIVNCRDIAMSTSGLIAFFDDALKSCGAVLILVIAYKTYKLKCGSTSSCGRYFSVHASNPGGAADTSEILEQVQHGQNSVQLKSVVLSNSLQNGTSWDGSYDD